MGKGTKQEGKPHPPVGIPHQRTAGTHRGNALGFAVEGQERREPDTALHHRRTRLEFINTGKREEAATDTEDGQAGAADDVPAPPAGTPQDNEDDLPF